MMTLEEIKNILFSDETNQQGLLKSMKCENSSFDEAFKKLIFESDELTLQKTLAPILRARAVTVLRESPTFEAWRRWYIRDQSADELKNFYDAQNTAGVYGTDECAKALAELLDVSLLITVPNTNYPSYAANTAKEEDRPFFHIYNQLNIHWYIYEGCPNDTLGDGNCLFNSFAQILRNEVMAAQYRPSSLVSEDHVNEQLQGLQGAELDVVSEFFKRMEVYKTQDSLRAEFDKLPKLSIEELANRIVMLRKEESSDHLCALNYAVSDDVIKSKNTTDKDKQVIPVESIEKIKTQLSDAGSKLIASIDTMHAFGQGLKDKKTSQIIIKLSNELKEKAKEAMSRGFYKQDNFPEFQREFSTLLNSKNKEMREYSVTWGVIVKNIVIALTGIGLLLVIGNLIYTQATEGHAMLFFQKPKMIAEEQLKAVESSMAVVAASSDEILAS